jgi:hypothetical protein
MTIPSPVADAGVTSEQWEQWVQTAARAAFRRDYSQMSSEWHADHEPERWHVALAERALAAVLPEVIAAVRAEAAREIERAIGGHDNPLGLSRSMKQGMRIAANVIARGER